jgi:hypothetical protein
VQIGGLVNIPNNKKHGFKSRVFLREFQRAKKPVWGNQARGAICPHEKALMKWILHHPINFAKITSSLQVNGGKITPIL